MQFNALSKTGKPGAAEVSIGAREYPRGVAHLVSHREISMRLAVCWLAAVSSQKV